jgi:OOP family OmpA-OmpF porin
MRIRFAALLALGLLVAALSGAGCATKKYTRNQINARVTPLEQRTGELEETSRRNSQDIGRLNESVTDVRARTDRAQNQADTALTRANQANTHVDAVEQTVSDLRANLDKFTVQNTATVNFKFDSYQLTPDARAGLDQLAAQIKDRKNFILEIEGFADSTGANAYNNQLTQRRATSVQRYLAEQHNIPLYRMHIIGFGEMRPVADNRTRAGRAENRRVEIRLLTRSATDSAPQASSKE